MFPLYDTVRSHKFPFINLTLIAANALAFLYEIQMDEPALQGFIFTWGLIPSQFISDPTSTWRNILTSMFLHGGWFHIINNMWVLFIFGDNIEAHLGGIRYLIFYLLGGAAAGLLQTYVLPTSTIPMVTTYLTHKPTYPLSFSAFWASLWASAFSLLEYSR
jgi:membrane associated rhomboid family serine protease